MSGFQPVSQQGCFAHTPSSIENEHLSAESGEQIVQQGKFALAVVESHKIPLQNIMLCVSIIAQGVNLSIWNTFCRNQR